MSIKKVWAVGLTGIVTLVMAACSIKQDLQPNLVAEVDNNRKTVNLFGPMEKSKPGADGI